MTTEETVIKLAYQACAYTPSQESFRLGEQKKTYNPVHTAPTLNRVITHLEGQRDFAWARGQARQLVLEQAAADYVNQLQTSSELRHFLATLSLFLKTTATKERKAMRSYTDRAATRLDTEATAQKAWRIVQDVKWQKELNRNKVTRLAGRIRGAQSKWECLAILAQYYPLRGVSQALINRLVEELEPVDLATFQSLVNQTLILYSAEDARS